MFTINKGWAAGVAKPVADEFPRDALGDYRTDKRMLLLSALAIPVGIIGALVAKVLLWLIATITNLLFFHRFSAQSLLPEDSHLGWWLPAVPIAGALIIGLMARYGSEKIRGHGIPEALEAILLGRSLISPKVAILKPLSSAISIGSGGPFGAEGPIIMTGGAFGSLFAQLFHLSAAERKTLLVAGAAAGMSAMFATPVAAVLLAVELLLFEWKPRSFIPVAVASIVASLLRIPLLGAGPMFPVTPHRALGTADLFSALLVGITVGFGSWLLTSLVYAFEDLFQKLPIHWMWWPALGALVVGLGGLIEPRVLGVGYDTIHALVRGQLLGDVLIGLLIAKAVVWTVALGSGTSGGVLAPLLIIGGSLGALLGQWLPSGDPGLWAMVGMGAIMGGTMRSPFTGMIFTLELTHDLNALPALFIGSVAALGVTVLVLRRSILTEKLARRGQHIAREYSVDVFELVRVAEVMERRIPMVPADMTVRELSDRIALGDPAVSRRQAVLIMNANQKLAGIITRGDLVRALEHAPADDLSVLEAGRAKLEVTYPDESVHDAIAKMLRHGVGRLPVVKRDEPDRAVGYLGRGDILGARRRLHEEEESRSQGPAATRRPVLKFRTLLHQWFPSATGET
ncbi:MAG TPA: chloride channel protein [Verrucomicrobiae bacterium]|nr:chloride channel protein [Verrucomicrobiae bacterium]